MTLLGQLVFLYHLVDLYIPSTVTGHLEDWHRNKSLFKGYVPGDTIGNLTFAAHVMCAVVIALGGMLQLVPQIRARAIAVHRWNGRAFMLAAVVAALAGLYMNWIRHARISAAGSIGVTLNGVLILLFVAAAWRAVRAGDIERHRRWALRAFLAVNGVFFIRLGYYGWIMLTHGAGLNKTMTGPMNLFFEFASYVMPIGILELYLRARASRSRNAQLATAVVLLVITLCMCVGTVAYTMAVRRV